MCKGGSERIVQFWHDKVSESLQFHPVSKTGLEDLFSVLPEVCRELIQTSLGIVANGKVGGRGASVLVELALLRSVGAEVPEPCKGHHCVAVLPSCDCLAFQLVWRYPPPDVGIHPASNGCPSLGRHPTDQCSQLLLYHCTVGHETFYPVDLVP